MQYGHTGTIQKWKPDLEVFTDIDIPLEYYLTTLKAGGCERRASFHTDGRGVRECYEFCYEKG